MRSRFSAFARSEVDYLVRTTASSNPELRLGTVELRRQLLASCKATRFVRLRVLDARSTSDTTAQVLFHAEMYRSGKEVSFVELSDFIREAGHWRYVAGEARSLKASALKDTLRIEDF